MVVAVAGEPRAPGGSSTTGLHLQAVAGLASSISHTLACRQVKWCYGHGIGIAPELQPRWQAGRWREGW